MAVKEDNLVLVIDDEEPVREAISDILALDGLKVIKAENGLDGIDKFQERPSAIKLIILDLTMPGLSGIETLARLQAIDPNVTVLLSSGYSQIDIKEKFASLGANGFLQKPYNAVKLLEIVRSYMA